MRRSVRKLAVSKRKELMKKKNVVGVMAGKEFRGGKKTERDAVVVLVEKKIDVTELSKDDLVPRRFIDGGSEVPTDVIEVGVIRALHKRKHRPVLPGTSIGHFAITAGTLGIVVDRAGQQYILSNNHVLANENNADIGDAILQPGPTDGGREEDKVAELADFIPINFQGVNLVDAALAKFVGDETPEPPPPVDPPPPEPPEERNFFEKVWDFIVNFFRKLFGRKEKETQTVTVGSQATEGKEYLNEPLNLGPITRDIGEVTVGDTVKKSGRTTGVTVDEVLGIDAAANVQYDGGVAEFVDQIICGPMSAGGDSGSVVYDADGNAIGLLFAGSNTVTIVNRIQDVFTKLEIDKIS
jgi:hypothetical protein